MKAIDIALIMRPRLKKRGKLNKSEQMARVRSKDTDLETMLRRALWAQGFRYRIRLRLPGTPDLAFVKQKVAVFIDGCFWHGCPQHYTKPVKNAEFWSTKLARNLSRDRRVDEELTELGWTVVRIWGHEISDDLAATAAGIADILKGRED